MFLLLLTGMLGQVTDLTKSVFCTPNYLVLSSGRLFESDEVSINAFFAVSHQFKQYINHKNVKVKQSGYRPGVAQRVSES